MSDDDGLALVASEDPPDRPRVVEEAYEVLGTYGWQLTGVAAAVAAAWLAAEAVGLGVPWLWPIAIVAFLLVLYLWPIAREPRLARDVLRRWDVLRVERALESSGVTWDPRMEVAEAMAHRIVRHPSVGARVRETTTALVTKLRFILRDLRRIEYLSDVKASTGDRRTTRSISDLHDLLDARAAEVLGQITELHRTVVLRDAASLEKALGHVDELLAELGAEEEVERLLSQAEQA